MQVARSTYRHDPDGANGVRHCAVHVASAYEVATLKSKFAGECPRRGMISDLEVFIAAVFTYHVCRVFEAGIPLSLHLLLKGYSKASAACGQLAHLALVKPMQKWFAARFDRTVAE